MHDQHNWKQLLILQGYLLKLLGDFFSNQQLPPIPKFSVLVQNPGARHRFVPPSIIASRELWGHNVFLHFHKKAAVCKSLNHNRCLNQQPAALAHTNTAISTQTQFHFFPLASFLGVSFTKFPCDRNSGLFLFCCRTSFFVFASGKNLQLFVFFAFGGSTLFNDLEYFSAFHSLIY